MDSLRCVMADHESQGKPIIGICIDKNCKASQRILCVTCQKKYHNTCQRDSTLDKDEILEKLKSKVKDQERQSPLYQFQNLRSQINKIFDQLEKDFQISQKNYKIMSSNRIQELQRTPFTMELWNECYQQLQEAQYPVNTKQNKIVELLDQIEELLNDISMVQHNFQFDKQYLLHLSISQPIKQVSQTFEKRIIQVRNKSIFSIDCSPCGKYIACAAGRIVITFDLLSQQKYAQGLELHENIINQVRCSPNGKLIASASSDYTIILWDSSTLNQIGQNLHGHENYVQSVAFSPNNKHLVSGSSDQSIRIWNIESQQQVDSIKADSYIYYVEYSSNGLQILSAGLSGNLVIWDSKTKQQLLKLIGHKSGVDRATYSFDQKIIVSCSQDKIIKIWNAMTGQQIGDDLVGHEDQITSVAISPDSSLIASASIDKTVRLWDLKTGNQVSILHTHGDIGHAVRFSNDGKYVLSGSSDNTICIIKIRND